jgi:hypothetical protein
MMAMATHNLVRLISIENETFARSRRARSFHSEFRRGPETCSPGRRPRLVCRAQGRHESRPSRSRRTSQRRGASTRAGPSDGSSGGDSEPPGIDSDPRRRSETSKSLGSPRARGRVA